MTNTNTIVQTTPELQPFLPNADHVDVITAIGDVTMREFLAGTFSYNPGWLTFLYRVRGKFVRLLGMKQEGVPQFPEVRPEEVCMTPGENMAFFTVKTASEQVWIAGIEDTHLSAELSVVKEAGENGRFRFHIVTIVHYHNWSGILYFNVIRPFHHLVVAKMAQAGANYQTSPLRTV